ncbi:hypothetical protein TWF718_003820 [Orbilia javanica]|uniref:ORC6 first cyclin-like domain-containing protein n=1 Tax=Orbilia javanica TaxID=47235 RepID=A0AAN8RKI3_9PEZI
MYRSRDQVTTFDKQRLFLAFSLQALTQPQPSTSPSYHDYYVTTTTHHGPESQKYSTTAVAKMSRTIERTLTMLLPTATGGIPRELIDTTSSLIAQSRHKLSNLKQAEEPAREMLCAHLACERLRTKLDLPVLPDKPPAPVPPRLYKTLYKQFSETLVIGSAARTATVSGSTPADPHGGNTGGRSRTRDSATTTAAAAATTGSKPKSAFIKNTPASSSSSAASKDKKIEPYIPIIHELCNNNADKPAIRHITAGASYIFSSAKYRNLTETPYTLIGVLYVVVVKELKGEDGFEGQPEEEKRGWYDGKVGEVYKCLKGRGVVRGREGNWKEEFGEVLAEVAGQDMRETRWFMDMVDGRGGGVEEEEEEEEEVEGAGEEGGNVVKVKGKRKAAEQGMESGIGSMMQDRLDFLSDKRRKAFAEWKTDTSLIRKVYDPKCNRASRLAALIPSQLASSITGNITGNITRLQNSGFPSGLPLKGDPKKKKKMNPSGHEGFEAGPSANNHGGRPKLEHLQSHFSHIAPHLKAHLTDRQANPILSTSEPASGYLAPLSEAFVNAYETGSRMGLGMPVRVTLSTTESSLVVLQSAPTSSGTAELSSVPDQKARQQVTPVSPILTAENGPDTSKMLVSTVIAPAGELAEARVAIWAIEDVARRLQTSLEK